ncbi:MAG: hypothetical protein PHF24_05600 [Syntrophomonas sp.]|nr:hypothetical protein [Syntrophomonas sp.]
MFAAFLNKENVHSLDLSVFINYSPEQLMFYYYNSSINIGLDTYLQIKEWLANSYGNSSNLKRWLNFIDTELDVELDIIALQEDEYLNSIGPYYYGPTCTRFFFPKLYAVEHELLDSSDFAFLFNFHKVPPASKDLLKYSTSSRRIVKKRARNKDELIRDIDMCLLSLEQIEKITQNISYFNIFIKERHNALAALDSLPQEPAAVPDKPSKPQDTSFAFNRLLVLSISPQTRKDYQQRCSDYNRNMKIHYIRCREYEKACDRYKDALQDWNQHKEIFIKKCQNDIKNTTHKLKEAQALLDIYNRIIETSFVHSDYREYETLNSFRRYLETGRANDIQECMNMYEEERLWIEIKASQERIENTIYFLQGDYSDLSFVNEQTSRLLASARE